MGIDSMQRCGKFVRPSRRKQTHFISMNGPLNQLVTIVLIVLNVTQWIWLRSHRVTRVRWLWNYHERVACTLWPDNGPSHVIVANACDGNNVNINWNVIRDSAFNELFVYGILENWRNYSGHKKISQKKWRTSRKLGSCGDQNDLAGFWAKKKQSFRLDSIRRPNK